MHIWLLGQLLGASAAPLGRALALPAMLRPVLALFAALALCLLIGSRTIGWLSAWCREPIRTDSPLLNRLLAAKQAVPTMGGLFVVASLLISIALFCDPAAREVQVAIVVLLGMTAIGLADDAIKLTSQRKGLTARHKLAAQTLVALIAATMLQTQPASLGPQREAALFLPVVVLLIVGFSNGVNLTDGLDGLAAGCLMLATAAVAGCACFTGQDDTETLVVAAALIGAVVGFLWFNRHPARVFLGNTGSLSLGGLLGLLAVMLDQELTLLVAGGVFVAEAASVALQVGSFKLTGRRVLLCAPLHHHFQFLGWPETKIVKRFWQAAACCALVAVGMGAFAARSSDRLPSAAQVGAGRVAAQDRMPRGELR